MYWNEAKRKDALT